MYGDTISIGDAATIFFIAILIVFLALALLFAVLMLFKLIGKKQVSEQKPTSILSSNQNSFDDESELLVVFASAIKAYE